VVKRDPGDAEQQQTDQAKGRGNPVPLVELFQPEGFAFLVHHGKGSAYFGGRDGNENGYF
jgi:hypothetical protein